MILTGDFDFVSSYVRKDEAGNQINYVTLLSDEGEVRTFRCKEFVEPFVMGDRVKGRFKVFKAKDNAGFIVSLQQLDVTV